MTDAPDKDHPPAPGAPDSRWRSFLAPALAVAVILVIAFRAPRAVSDLRIVPDEVELSLVGLSIVQDHDFLISVAGRDLPSRYPPWFPLFVTAPSYLLFGSDLGAATFGIALFGALGALCAYLIGRRSSGEIGGALAALAVIFLTDYRYEAQVIRTDAPNAALVLAASWLYLRTRAAPSRMGYLSAGLVVAVAGGFRASSLSLAIPFVLAGALDLVRPKPGRKRVSVLIDGCLFALPIVIQFALTRWYNAAHFGDASRNGYQFWCPVPYDYPAMVLSEAFIAPHFDTLLRVTGKLLAGALGGMLLYRGILRRRLPSPIVDQLMFLIASGGPVAVFYLMYFYDDGRFYLPITVLAAALVGSLIGSLIPRRAPGWLGGAALAAALCVAVAMRYRQPAEQTLRRDAVDRINALVPAESWLISAIDPAYLQHYCGQNRRIIPIARGVEYADKLIAWKRIEYPDPPPTTVDDHRAPGLQNGGAEEAVEFVAAEKIAEIVAAVNSGTSVYVETKWAKTPGAEYFLKAIDLNCVREPIGEDLYSIKRRDSAAPDRPTP